MYERAMHGHARRGYLDATGYKSDLWRRREVVMHVKITCTWPGRMGKELEMIER